MPTERTKAEYRRLARYFVEKRLGGQSPTPKRLTDALQACAGEYRPAYWRRLRCALVQDQEERGYGKAAERLRKTRNPVTTGRDGKPLPSEERTVKAKQRRARSISQEDRSKLLRAAKALGDGDETRASIVLAERLGVRPAEMVGLQVDQERGVVLVNGAKKTG
ncbi:MAG: hypothetical protein LC667_05655, partial [Thioalkalivibrio sp.]|nr:hypothetical protein [Thioalkalivibrio sp.]